MTASLVLHKICNQTAFGMLGLSIVLSRTCSDQIYRCQLVLCGLQLGSTTSLHTLDPVRVWPSSATCSASMQSSKLSEGGFGMIQACFSVCMLTYLGPTVPSACFNTG